MSNIVCLLRHGLTTIAIFPDIPWYFCLKSVGIVALQRPNGAIPLYDNVLRPAFFKNKKANVPVAQPATSYTVPVSDRESCALPLSSHG